MFKYPALSSSFRLNRRNLLDDRWNISNRFLSQLLMKQSSPDKAPMQWAGSESHCIIAIIISV